MQRKPGTFKRDVPPPSFFLNPIGKGTAHVSQTKYQQALEQQKKEEEKAIREAQERFKKLKAKSYKLREMDNKLIADAKSLHARLDSLDKKVFAKANPQKPFRLTLNHFFKANKSNGPVPENLLHIGHTSKLDI